MLQAKVRDCVRRPDVIDQRDGGWDVADPSVVRVEGWGAGMKRTGLRTESPMHAFL